MRVFILPGGWLEAKGLQGVLGGVAPPLEVEPLREVGDAPAALDEDPTAVLIVRGGGKLFVELARELSLAGPNGRVLAIAAPDGRPAGLFRSVSQGWSVVLESADEDALRHAVRTVVAGHWFIDPVVIGLLSAADDEGWGTKVLERIDPAGVLPRHTWGVALLMVRGLADREIAVLAGKSVETIRSYSSEIRERLGVSGRRELMRLAQGWPPCNGVASRCAAPARAAPGVPLGRDAIPSCPCFPFCVAALRNY